MIAEMRIEPKSLGRASQAREVRFEARPSIHRETVDVFAARLSERLSELFGREVRARGTEPVAAPPPFDVTLTIGARAYVVDATKRGAVVMFDADDARRLAAYVFNENATGSADLTRIEDNLIQRIASEAIELASSFLGEAQRFAPATTRDVRNCVTSFSLRLQSPADVTIAFGLTEARDIGLGAPLAPQALFGVTVDAQVEFARTSLTASDIASLRIGSIVSFETTLDDPAVLRIGENVVAMGTCGASDGAAAFIVVPQAQLPPGAH